MKNKKLLRLTIFGVEQTFKNKVWIILNILMVIATIVAVNFSTVKKIVNLKSSGSVDDKDIINVMIMDETGRLEKYISENKGNNIEIKEYEENAVENGNILIELKYDDKQYVKAKITSKEYIDMTYYDIFQTSIDSVRNEIFSEVNSIDISDAEKLNKQVEIERVITEMDNTTYEKYSSVFFGATFVIYILFIFIASSLASTIGMEKISRTTEYMLTGISENAYLWYNILQTNIVIILQTALGAIYFLVATLIRGFLMSNFLGMEISFGNAQSASAISATLEPVVVQAISIALVQAILGILILSIVQAVISSRVNNMSDVSNSTVLVLFFVIFATMFFPNIIPVSENVNVFLKIVSLIPVVSTIAVPKLLLLGQVDLLFGILSVIISVIFVIVATIVGSKLFKKGLLSINKGSKKEERVSEAKEADLNESKLKLSISRVAMALVLYLICSNVLGILKEVLFSSVTSTVLNYIISMIIWIMGIYPSYWYLKNGNVEKPKNEKKTSTKSTLLAIVAGFGLCMILQMLIGLLDVSSTDLTGLMGLDLSKPAYCILTVIYIAVLPAVFEELLFRKAIFGSLKKYGKVFAMLCSSIAFALIHQNLSQGIAAFGLGMIFCMLDDNVGSLIPSMVIHFLNNLIGVIQMILTEHSEVALNIFGNILTIISIAAGVFAIILLIVLKKKKYKFITEAEDKLVVKKPLKVICTDFITMMTLFIYIVITVCVTDML